MDVFKKRNKKVDTYHIHKYNKHKQNQHIKSYSIFYAIRQENPNIKDLHEAAINSSNPVLAASCQKQKKRSEASYTGKNTEKGAKPMGQKDITEKVLEDYNDVFADIINGLLFDGVQEIKPEALENTTVHAQYKAEDGKVHELERDIAKYWKEEKVELAICGIENQSTVEKHMPFRIIGYDGSAYRNQLQQERRKMLPVVTIVLYFGTDRHWNSRKKIKELMEIPKCLDRYVNDYQMHVFEVAWLTEEQISHFRSDFKVVANFFVQKRKNRDYIPDDPTEIRHVDEVLKLLKVMTGDRRYEEIFRKKKGVRSMCDVAERLEKMGIAKGIEIGRSEGKMEGEIKGKMLVYKNLCREGFGEKEARRLTELPEDVSLEKK